MVRSITAEVWVTCISHVVKQDLCNLLNLEPERIFVTPLAASKSVFHETSGPEAEAVRQRYGLSDSRYILSLSAIDPRKNLGHLVDSFARLTHERGLEDVKLALVGHYWPHSPEFSSLRSKHPSLTDRIVFTGFVPNSDLAALYSGAVAFAFPSLAEGFGLPPLEAMQCGTPVISSNATSLPEVVGDAGLLLDPRDQDAWCDAMLRLCSDETLRAQFRAQSLRRAEHFTWEKTIDALVAAYLQAITTGDSRTTHSHG